MHFSVRCPGWRRLVAGGLLASYLPACTSWQPQGPTPEAVIRRGPAVVRLTRSDHSFLVLHNPTLAADTVLGQLGSPQPTDGGMRPVAVPLSTIEVVSLRRLNVLKTTGAVLGSLLLLGVVSCAATQCLEIKPPQ